MDAGRSSHGIGIATMIKRLRLPVRRQRSVVGWLRRILLAAVFLYAGATKLLEPAGRFADSVASFRLLPSVLIAPFTLAVPPFEVLLGLSLLTGFPARLGSSGAFALTAMFLIAMGLALLRGIPVDCGCFGAGLSLLPLTATQRAWFDLARDIFLNVLAFTLYRLELPAASSKPGA